MFYNNSLRSQKDKFTVYCTKGRTLLSFIQNGNAIVLSDSKLSMDDKIFKFNVYNHLSEERISKLMFTSFQDSNLLVKKTCPYGQFIVWQGKKILRINNYEKENLPFEFLNELDYIIVSDNKFYHQLKQSKIFLLTVVLIDSSVKEKSSAGAEDFYDIRKRGAFVFSE